MSSSRSSDRETIAELIEVLRALLMRTTWNEFGRIEFGFDYCAYCGISRELAHAPDCPYERAWAVLNRIEAAGDENWLPF